MSHPPLRIGVAGLGRAFTLMLPTLPRGSARAARGRGAIPLPAARAQFERDFGGRVHADVEALAADPTASTSSTCPRRTACTRRTPARRSRAGGTCWWKSRWRVSLDDCTAMIDAARAARRHLVVGHSHSFDAPLPARARARRQRRLRCRAHAARDRTSPTYMYRARRPEEMRTDDGGGVLFSQAAHQIDIVRLLGGGLVTRRARAHRQLGSGAPDRRRLQRAAHLRQRRLCERHLQRLRALRRRRARWTASARWASRKSDADYGAARRRLRDAPDAAAETALKAARNYGGARYVPSLPRRHRAHHQHFGQVIVSCERADLRPTPSGVAIYADDERRFEPRAGARRPARRGHRRAVARGGRRRAAAALGRVGARHARGVPRDARVGPHRTRGPAAIPGRRAGGLVSAQTSGARGVRRCA